MSRALVSLRREELGAHCDKLEHRLLALCIVARAAGAATRRDETVCTTLVILAKDALAFDVRQAAAAELAAYFGVRLP